MVIDQTVSNQIANALSRHFESLYYVDISTGAYIEFIPPLLLEKQHTPEQGDDFFEMSRINAPKYVHPDDLETVLRIHNKDVILDNLSRSNSYSVSARLVIDGKVVHIRHIDIMCEDKKHILCCMENTEAEYLEKEEHSKNLESAERMARRDELTGIKNKTAFTELSASLERDIQTKGSSCRFGVVMCDINDLKVLNDTRGHSFGDEAIQKASRMICNVFKHSPVFRIGGDEFVVILSEIDYEQRTQLLTMLRNESNANSRYRSGPVVASGMAEYDPENDTGFSSVFERADQLMYENKNELKSRNIVQGFRDMDKLSIPIPDERKRLLDSMFGALYTVSNGGYVYLNDMRYDFSRWSLPLIDDFGLQSEYMYHADSIWKEYIHPDDLDVYQDAVDAVLHGNAELRSIYYRARKTDGSYVLLTTRGFVLSDSDGNPEYFGGIIIST